VVAKAARQHHWRMHLEEETMTTFAATSWVELAQRASNGLEVTLLWNRSTNRVKVAVIDERLCQHLDLDIAGADALSAFHHPFAYAAARLAPIGTDAATPGGEQRVG
jgi:hypothetical protein